jgi:hypothetical protein
MSSFIVVIGAECEKFGLTKAETDRLHNIPDTGQSCRVRLKGTARVKCFYSVGSSRCCFQQQVFVVVVRHFGNVLI